MDLERRLRPDEAPSIKLKLTSRKPVLGHAGRRILSSSILDEEEVKDALSPSKEKSLSDDGGATITTSSDAAAQQTAHTVAGAGAGAAASLSADKPVVVLEVAEVQQLPDTNAEDERPRMRWAKQDDDYAFEAAARFGVSLGRGILSRGNHQQQQQWEEGGQREPQLEAALSPSHHHPHHPRHPHGAQASPPFPKRRAAESKSSNSVVAGAGEAMRVAAAEQEPMARVSFSEARLQLVHQSRRDLRSPIAMPFLDSAID